RKAGTMKSRCRPKTEVRHVSVACRRSLLSRGHHTVIKAQEDGNEPTKELKAPGDSENPPNLIYHFQRSPWQLLMPILLVVGLVVVAVVWRVLAPSGNDSP